jgi:hypothetical protein
LARSRLHRYKKPLSGEKGEAKKPGHGFTRIKKKEFIRVDPRKSVAKNLFFSVPPCLRGEKVFAACRIGVSCSSLKISTS